MEENTVSVRLSKAGGSAVIENQLAKKLVNN